MHCHGGGESRNPAVRQLLTRRLHPSSMRIEKKTLNWFPKASTWDHQQSLNAKRKAQAEGHMNQAAATTAFFSVAESQSYGTVELAIKVAVARLQNKTA